MCPILYICNNKACFHKKYSSDIPITQLSAFFFPSLPLPSSAVHSVFPLTHMFLLPLPPGMTKALQAADLPSRLVLDSVVCLLRTLMVGVGVHSDKLSSRATHSVASLLRHLVQCGAVRGTAHSSLWGDLCWQRKWLFFFYSQTSYLLSRTSHLNVCPFFVSS